MYLANSKLVNKYALTHCSADLFPVINLCKGFEKCLGTEMSCRNKVKGYKCCSRERSGLGRHKICVDECVGIVSFCVSIMCVYLCVCHSVCVCVCVFLWLTFGNFFFYC